MWNAKEKSSSKGVQSGQSTTFLWRLPAGATSESGTDCPTVSGQIVTVRLPAGLHTLTLEARDGSGNVSTDAVVVRVKAL